jgi:very-short-patch-repair endonuclease
MKPLVGLIVLLLILGVLAALLKKRPKSVRGPWPLEVRKTILSPPEQVLYRHLVQALPQNLVFAQVQVSRFLDVRRRVPRLTWLNRINQMSADFLVLNPDTSFEAAIELDDASHGSPSRRDAGARKTQALQSAGVKLIRWNVKSLPDEAAIRAAVVGAATAGRS